MVNKLISENENKIKIKFSIIISINKLFVIIFIRILQPWRLGFLLIGTFLDKKKKSRKHLLFETSCLATFAHTS
jgi:hypothetical protein